MSFAPSDEKSRHQKALALIVCLFIGFIYVETVWKPYFFGTPIAKQSAVQGAAPQQPQSQALVSNQDSKELVSQAPAGREQIASGQGSTTPSGFPSTAQLESAGTVRVITDELNIEFSLLGGRIVSAGLETYKQDQKTASDYEIVSHAENNGYPLGVSSGEFSDLWTNYRVVSPPQLRGGAGELRLDSDASETQLVLRGTLSDGREVTKKFSFKKKGFLVDVDLNVNAPTAGADPLIVDWRRFVTEEAGLVADPYKAAGFAWFDGQKAFREAFSDVESNEQALGKVNWVSVSSKYFAAILIRDDEAAPAKFTKVGDNFTAELFGSSTNNTFTLFLGPKSYRLLDAIGFELQRIIDFGIFGIVSAPLLSLLHLLFDLFHNYGLAIVTLTIIVRLALFPLNSASFKQMKAMQDLKPELDKLKETVKDKQKQQAALMELYKKKGVNPLGGCLPMFLQFPIFLGLYSALLLSVELRHAHFAGWITDLSAPEQLMIAGVGIPVVVILWVISMMAQQFTTPSTMDPTQKKVMMFMPVVMGFFFLNMPSGLTLYWLTSNLISIGQQKAMHHKEGDPKAALKITLAVSLTVFALAAFVVMIG